MSHDSSSIEIEGYSNGKGLRLKLVSSPTKVQVYYKLYYPGVSHTHLNWHVIL